MKDLKYLFAYVAPAAAFAGIYYGGWTSFGAAYVAFVALPILEFFFKGTEENLSEEEEMSKLKNRFFDILLYLNIPILYTLVWYYFSRIYAGGLEIYEIVGMTVSVGILASTIGINVAHELGHRSTKFEQFLSKVLLMIPLYMHFFIEHNRGHHKNIATDEDPASSRLGETLYAFCWRSVTDGYKSAWHLEAKRLERAGLANLSWNNEMIRFQIIQITYLLVVGLIFGWQMILFAIAIAVLGFLLLEMVNYIEHYGLRRKKLPSGRYEKVRAIHSWNSNHELGRIFLYELTRHSDHHYKASRKYQTLRHFDESPQLPYGYPTSILIATIPPLWFKIMDKEVAKYQTRLAMQ